jgi:hypothetical protein
MTTRACSKRSNSQRRRKVSNLALKRTISINRAQVLTLWAAVVAGRFGFNRDAALTLGRAVAGQIGLLLRYAVSRNPESLSNQSIAVSLFKFGRYRAFRVAEQKGACELVLFAICSF